MKKRFFLILMITLFVSLLAFTEGYAESRTETVHIQEVMHGADEKSMGSIEQMVTTLKTGDVVQIDMREVYSMYPEHTGVYGILYTSGNVTITETGKSKPKTVSGTGTLQFAFQGADGCKLTGSGTVYAYFLPVAYKKLSTKKSLVNQPFDTEYVTKTSVGHYNMFMLADPKVYVYQNNVPLDDTVYKTSTVLGPLPKKYQYLEGYSGLQMYSFVSERPVLVQCCAIQRSVYDKDTYFARPMKKITGNSDYEIWQYTDCGNGGKNAADRIRNVFNTCMEIAHEEFITETVTNTPVMITLLGEELSELDLAGRVLTDEMYERIGFYSLIQLNTTAWKYIDDYATYLFAHEIGHIVHSRTLSSVLIGYASWYNEGFATFFGEKVCRRLGINNTDHGVLCASDNPAIEKFYNNLTFGISNFMQYQAVGFDNSEVLLLPNDPYTFGCCFMEYLEEKYGAGFYKKISDSFYQNWYKGYESNFFYRRNDLDYNIDEVYRLIRIGLSEDIYTGFPDYVQEKYGLVMRQLSVPKVSIVNSANGVKVTWNKITGADGYLVYRSNDGKTWTKLKQTTGLSYTDTTATSGKTYYYSVKAFDKTEGKILYSNYDKTKKIIRLKQPAITLSNTSTGAKISWGKVIGAAGYEVYRSTNGKSWTKIKTTTSTSYTDTKATAGKTYYYTVKAYKTLSGTKIISSCDKTKKIIRLKQPAVTLSNTSTGAKVSWGKVTGADGYLVYRSTNGTTWTKLKQTTGLTYTDTNAAAGKTYYYTVKAFDKSTGKIIYSSIDNTKKIIRLKQPAVKVSAVTDGVKVSWGKITGADGYLVYRSTDGKNWTKIKQTTSLNYTDKTAAKGKTYYYTVKAFDKSTGKTIYSSIKASSKVKRTK